VAGSFLIFLREGIEGSMICAILLTYLAAGGRRDMFRWVLGGAAVALAGSAVVGGALYILVRSDFVGSRAQAWFETITFAILEFIIPGYTPPHIGATDGPVEFLPHVGLPVETVATMAEAPAVGGQKEVAARAEVLVDLEADATTQLEPAHPHELVYVDAGQVQQRLPVGLELLEQLAALGARRLLLGRRRRRVSGHRMILSSSA
jgi:hypothetical protein